MTAGDRVVGYVRVSTREQGDSGAGLAAQRDAIEAEARRRGWTLVEVFEDVESGKSTNGRAGLARALEAVEGGEASAIVVAKLDRLSRSLVDFAQMIERSRKAGWSLVVLDLGIDTTTANGGMLAGMLAVLAEWERRMISERTKAALAVRKREGVRLGRPPLIPPDVERYVRRERKKGASLQAIADALNAAGVPAPGGGREWRPSSLRRVVRDVEIPAKPKPAKPPRRSR